MTNTATVILWGTVVGYLHLEENKKYAAFEYDKDFISMGIEISPIKMPLSNRVYEFPELSVSAFKGVPGLLSDSLPDKFGNAVINQWLASQGRRADTFNVVERLCYTGKRGMGALEYVPEISPNTSKEDIVDVSKLVDFASAILQERQGMRIAGNEEIDYNQLLKLGTSAGGARAKAIIAYNQKTGEIRSGQVDVDEGYDFWLMKFDGVSKNGDHNIDDVPEYTLIEYSYYKMALKAGIAMSDCMLFNEGGRKHFMTKRFDRVNGKKLHMQTLGAITHIDYNEPGMCSYELAALTGREMGLPNIDIEEFFRRMVFNVLAINQDDHVKNISFLMDRSGTWSLAPAYDITFAYDIKNKWLHAHQMTVNGKVSNIKIEDMLKCGENMGLKIPKCKKIIEEVKSAVSEWQNIAEGVGVNKNTILLIRNEIEKQKI